MKVILEGEQISRTIRRMSHEIIEKNIDLTEVILIGIKSKGTPIAKVLSDNIYHFENVRIPVEEIDISKYRDDEKKTDSAILNVTSQLHDKVVILVVNYIFCIISYRLQYCFTWNNKTMVNYALYKGKNYIIC